MAALAVWGGASVGVSVPSGATTRSTKIATAPRPRSIAVPAPLCHEVPATGTTKATTACSTWTVRDAWAGHAPVVAVLDFHPMGQPVNVMAYASWLRSAATVVGLYPGYEGPGASGYSRGPEAVPSSGLPRLVATFNSGFYERDGAAGFYTHHTLYFPMVKGLATLVRYTNGTMGITRWGGGPTPGPTVVMARQNLPLLVDNASPTPGTANNAAGGLTLHGAPAVWRSAVGIDKNGNLIYAAAPAQTAASLAQVMVQLHCVRAMELDINPEWPIFVTYAGPGAQGPHLEVPNPNQIPGRFLYTSTKDFFAVYLSRGPGDQAPW